MDSREYAEENPTISRVKTANMLRSHNVPADERMEFWVEYGDHEEYNTEDVLGWLGY